MVGSLGAIKASITARGVEVDARKFFEGDVTVEESIFMDVRGALKGSLHSTEGDIYVDAGSLAASLTADAGSVGANVFGAVAGYDDPKVPGPAGPAKLHGRKGVTVSALGPLDANVSSPDGRVLVSADGAISGKIDAAQTADVLSWGAISAPITSKLSNVQVFAHGDVTGAIKAEEDVYAASWGSITKPITAGGGAEIFVRHNLTGGVTAGESVKVTAGGSVGAAGAAVSIVAGAGSAAGPYDATVVASGAVEGEDPEDPQAAPGGVTADVTASRNATVDSLGFVAGDVTAKTGQATVSALGDYQGNVQAGRDAKLTVGGDLASSNATAGQSAQISVHGGITNLTVEAERRAEVLSDTTLDDSTITVGPLVGGAATVAALDEATSVTVKTGGDASLFAGGDSSFTVETTIGDIDATVLGDLTGSYTAGGDARLTAYGAMSQLTAEAKTGDAVLFAEGNLDATATAARAMSVDSLQNITGNYASRGSADVYAGGSFNATLTAAREVGVVAGDSVAGSIESKHHSAVVVSQGRTGSLSAAVSATVTARRDATVSTSAGDVAGKVTATKGSAKVTSGARVTGGVEAGRNADVWALDSISGQPITAGANAYVVTLADLAVKVEATAGLAYVSAGTDVNGEVTANQDALVRAQTGRIAKPVTSQTGSLLAVALGDITGETTAARHAQVAALGNITAPVTATTGSAVAAALGGSLSAPVTAGLNLMAYAGADISGALDAGLDAYASALGNQSGNVTAGRDAAAIAAGNVSGAITAARFAYVNGFAGVTGNVTATSQDAMVVSANAVTSTITVGGLAAVVAGGVADITVASAENLYVQAFGTLEASAPNVAEDIFLWSGGNLSGGVDAGRDALAVSAADSALNLSAGRDAGLVVMGDHRGPVNAGRDALVFAWGGASGSITAGQDASLYAVDYALGSIDAGRYAGLVTWGAAAGPYTVSGDAGAFGWVYGDFGGDITSSAGSASLVAYGDAVGNVNADQYAFAYVVGDFLGTATAGESAAVAALGSYYGAIQAGASAAVSSEGDVNAQIAAGQDASIYAGGDLRGTYTAGRDAAAYTLGDFNAGLSAARDVVSVETGGDLTGYIIAGRNIGVEAYSYYYDYPGIIARGAINAGITAEDSGADGQGGKIGKIVAWDDIDGTITADGSIEQIRAGGSVNAQVASPSPPEIIGSDYAIPLDYPSPPPLESIVDDLLAEADATRQFILDGRDEEQAAIDAVFAEWKSDKQELADELAQVRAHEARELKDAERAVQQARADAEQAAQQRIDGLVADAQREYAVIVQTTAASEAAITATRDNARDDRDQNYQTALEERERLAKFFIAADILVAADRAEAITSHRQDLAARTQVWNQQLAALAVPPPTGSGGSAEVTRWFNDDWTDWVNPAAWLAARGDSLGDRIGSGFATEVVNPLSLEIYRLRQARIVGEISDPNSRMTVRDYLRERNDVISDGTREIANNIATIADGYVAQAELTMDVMTVVDVVPGLVRGSARLAPKIVTRGAKFLSKTASVAPRSTAGLTQRTPMWDAYPVSLSERLAAYKQWKTRAGISGKPTQAEFRRFIGAHRPNSRGATLYFEDGGFAAWSKRVGSTHGNTAGYQTAWLYRLENDAGEFLKWGVSQDPFTRYSGPFMRDKVIVPFRSGPRNSILQVERDLVERMPGPLNFEPWAGSRLGQ